MPPCAPGLAILLLVLAGSPTVRASTDYTISAHAVEDINFSDGQSKNGNVKLNHKLKFGPHGNHWHLIGLQFSSVALAQGATVSQATVKFTAKKAGSGSLTLRLRAVLEASDTALDDSLLTTRTLSTAEVSWAVGTWLSGQEYETPDIGSLVTEICGQASWTSGRKVTLLVFLESDQTSTDRQLD
eukprot:TRINITY_DN751_c0_g1_i2.p1 TRINITY_DN751_c0_g1~~TRINITY_DN751_c0_g1_i2.p1  ORF type:complete len:185 (+),score=48.67 TRINITY_DN751_c0_g1_i2:236-790(+)